MAWIFSTAALTSPVELLSEEVLVITLDGATVLLVSAEIFELPEACAPVVAAILLGRATELSPLSKAFKGSAEVSVKEKSFN